MSFPAAKLAGLILKQVSKPIASSIKTNAKKSPVFRRYVCIPPATFYNWCETRIKMWLLHLGQPVNIAVLSEEMAIDLGANLLGEGIIFLIAAGVLINEYNRSSKKETAKENMLRNELETLSTNIKELYLQVEEQQATIRHLTRLLGNLDTRVYQNTQRGHHHKHDDVHDNDKKPPPPRPPSQGPGINLDLHRGMTTIMPLNDNKSKPNDLLRHKSDPSQKSILFNALRNVEDTFREDVHWNKEDSIVLDALNFLCKDVYRVGLRF